MKSQNDPKNSPAAMSENGPKIESCSPEANADSSPKIKLSSKDNISVPTHLEELYSEAVSNCNLEEKRKIADLLVKYQDVFSSHEYDLGLCRLGEHYHIDTGDAKPIKQRQRRVPLALTDQEEKVIRQMEAQKIIRKSPWASPLCLVVKPNGKVRPCIDYRAVNKVTKPDSYPIPNTRDCLDAFAGAKLFSVLDLRMGYFLIPVLEEDIPKTAFVSKYGLYEHLTLPMGMMNSGSCFQRVMERCLAGLQWFICLVYLDDVCVFGKNFEEKSTSRSRSGKCAIRKRLPLQKTRWEKTKLTIRYLYHENIS